MTRVSSSMIADVSFADNGGAQEGGGPLSVTFTNGRTYHYENVPADEYTALLNSGSVGRYFIDNIKNQYRAR